MVSVAERSEQINRRSWFRSQKGVNKSVVEVGFGRRKELTNQSSKLVSVAERSEQISRRSWFRSQKGVNKSIVKDGFGRRKE